MVSNLFVFYNFEIELCFKVSLKFLNFVIIIKKNFYEIELVDVWKWILKDKILKFSWYNRIKVLFLVGSMCKYFLNLY